LTIHIPLKRYPEAMNSIDTPTVWNSNPHPHAFSAQSSLPITILPVTPLVGVTKLFFFHF